MKELHSRGFFADGKLVKVRVKECLPREQERYTRERCSLIARIMGDSADDETTAVNFAENSLASRGIASSCEVALCDGKNKNKIEGSLGSKSNVKVPASQAVAPLSSEAVKGVKALAAVFKKTKGKNTDRKVQSQIDEWIAADVITAQQENSIWEMIRNNK